MNDRMRRGCCRLLALLLTLVLVIPAYGQETLDALAAAQGCTAETLLQSDKLTAGDSVSDWVAIAVSRTGTEGDTSAYRKALERYVTRMYREQGGLDRLRATEWQRTALTALALGADPTAFGRDKNGRSVNLLADGVYQFTAAKSLGTQGLNGWIFGLIALDSARFAVPEDAVYTRAAILQALEACGEKTLPQGMEIVHTTETVEMCDDPATVFRRKKDTSMGVGLTMLRDGRADAMVSAGSTGALLTGATLIVKRIRGIRRAAMAPVIPTTTGQAVLIDCGANAECTPEYLVQFAYLGSYYAHRVLGVERPRVGLLNIGAEDSKGTDLQKETLRWLREAHTAGHLNFIGNIEAKEAIKGGCDVIVCDGFSGNVLLKTMEGVGSFAGSALKAMFKKNLLTKLAALCVMPGLNAFKAKLDPNKVGGTAFIGISRPVIKAHGSSNAEAIENAMGQAVQVARSGIIRDIEENVALMKVERE